MAKPRTLYDKIWDDHLVDEQPDGTCLLYIDRHLVHEVTSPQAFEGLRLTGRKVRRPDATLAAADPNARTARRALRGVGLTGRKVRRPDAPLAVPDHNVPTSDRSQPIADETSRI